MLVLGVGFVVWIAVHTPWLEVMARAQRVSPVVWLLAAVGMLCSYGARAARLTTEWYARAKQSGALRGSVWQAWWQCVQLVVLHNASVNFLPMRAGEMTYPLWLKRQWGVAISDSLASLLLLRLQDATVLLLLGCWAYSFKLGAMAVFAWVLLVGAMFLLAKKLGADVAANHSKNDGDGDGDGVFGKLKRALVQSRGGLWAWCWSVVNWCIKVSALGLLMQALLVDGAGDSGAGLSFLQGWQAALGGELAALWPVQPPAGLGTYELGVWLGQQVFGQGLSSLRSVVALFTQSGQTVILGAALVVHTFVLCCSAISASLVALWAVKRSGSRLQ